MKLQKALVKTWAKIELNSSYGFPPVPVIPMEYDENGVLQITEEGKKNLMVIQKALDMANKYRQTKKLRE